MKITKKGVLLFITVGFILVFAVSLFFYINLEKFHQQLIQENMIGVVQIEANYIKRIDGYFTGFFITVLLFIFSLFFYLFFL